MFRPSFRLGILLALLVVLASCSSDDPASSRQSEPPDGGSDGTESFASERHSYRLEVPRGWEVTEYGGEWTSMDQFQAGAEVPGEDVVSAPDVEAFLVANSMAIPEGTTPEAWVESLDSLVRAGRDPSCRETGDDGTLAGEPARILVHECPTMTLVGRSVTYGGRGYYFTIGYPKDASETGSTLEDVVTSIDFVEP